MNVYEKKVGTKNYLRKSTSALHQFNVKKKKKINNPFEY